MNATRNLKINLIVDEYERNGIGMTKKVRSRLDHCIQDPRKRHTQPHQPKMAATKPYKLYHKKKETINNEGY